MCLGCIKSKGLKIKVKNSRHLKTFTSLHAISVALCDLRNNICFFFKMCCVMC